MIKTAEDATFRWQRCQLGDRNLDADASRSETDSLPKGFSGSILSFFLCFAKEVTKEVKFAEVQTGSLEFGAEFDQDYVLKQFFALRHGNCIEKLSKTPVYVELTFCFLIISPHPHFQL